MQTLFEEGTEILYLPVDLAAYTATASIRIIEVEDYVIVDGKCWAERHGERLAGFNAPQLLSIKRYLDFASTAEVIRTAVNLADDYFARCRAYTETFGQPAPEEVEP